SPNAPRPVLHSIHLTTHAGRGIDGIYWNAMEYYGTKRRARFVGNSRPLAQPTRKRDQPARTTPDLPTPFLDPAFSCTLRVNSAFSQRRQKTQEHIPFRCHSVAPFVF